MYRFVFVFAVGSLSHISCARDRLPAGNCCASKQTTSIFHPHHRHSYCFLSKGMIEQSSKDISMVIVVACLLSEVALN